MCLWIMEWDNLEFNFIIYFFAFFCVCIKYRLGVWQKIEFWLHILINSFCNTRNHKIDRFEGFFSVDDFVEGWSWECLRYDIGLVIFSYPFDCLGIGFCDTDIFFIFKCGFLHNLTWMNAIKAWSAFYLNLESKSWIDMNRKFSIKLTQFNRKKSKILRFFEGPLEKQV